MDSGFGVREADERVQGKLSEALTAGGYIESSRGVFAVCTLLEVREATTAAPHCIHGKRRSSGQRRRMGQGARLPLQ